MTRQLPDGNIALGIDAGGTSTRWALADADGRVLAQGSVAGLTALMMGSETGRVSTGATASRLAQAVHAAGVGLPSRVLAGFTGYSGDAALRARLEALLAAALGLPEDRVLVASDIALACLDAFAPGGGYLVSAGTGSIAAYIDAQARFVRVGGRGSLIDDAGSGHWIAREAMRLVWRAEDEQPGSWRDSALAQALFEQIGGSGWSCSRDFLYQGTRGQVGELALAVAVAARQDDPVALGILQQAGVELARLALALTRRFGTRPVALSGRVVQLHPAIELGLRKRLGEASTLRVVALKTHETAARLAALDDPLLRRLSDLPDPSPAAVGAVQ